MQDATLKYVVLDARKAYKAHPDGQEYHMRHEYFYSMLRSTWERVVEEDLFKGVVMRFDSGISTQLLHSVVDGEDYRTIFNEMSDASGKIDAHDHAAGQHDTKHTPDDMDKALVRLKSFKKQLDAKQKEALTRRKNLVKTPLV